MYIYIYLFRYIEIYIVINVLADILTVSCVQRIWDKVFHHAIRTSSKSVIVLQLCGASALSHGNGYINV